MARASNVWGCTELEKRGISGGRSAPGVRVSPMPNRILRDAALDSDRLAAVSEPAEVLFYRLIMLADDFGRFDGRMSVIRSRAFALRQSVPEEEVSARMQELCKVGLIHSYSVSGKPYISIPRFGQRQRAEKSKFPAPPDERQTDDRQTTDGRLTSAAVVVVVGEDDIRSRSREKAAPPPTEEKAMAKTPWWKSNAGIDAMGMAMNMKPEPGENYPSYKDRIFARLQERSGRTHARGNDSAPPPAIDPDQGFPVKPRSKFDDEPEIDRQRLSDLQSGT